MPPMHNCDNKVVTKRNCSYLLCVCLGAGGIPNSMPIQTGLVGSKDTISENDTDYAVLIPNNQDTLLKWLSDLAPTRKDGRL